MCASSQNITNILEVLIICAIIIIDNKAFLRVECCYFKHASLLKYRNSIENHVINSKIIIGISRRECHFKRDVPISHLLHLYILIFFKIFFSRFHNVETNFTVLTLIIFKHIIIKYKQMMCIFFNDIQLRLEITFLIFIRLS